MSARLRPNRIVRAVAIGLLVVMGCAARTRPRSPAAPASTPPSWTISSAPQSSSRTCLLDVTALDERGAVLPSVNVVLLPAAPGAGVITGVTDDDGHVTIDHVEPGRREVVLVIDDREIRGSLTFEAGTVTKLRARIRMGYE